MPIPTLFDKNAQDLSLRSTHVPSEEIAPLGQFDHEPVDVVIQQHDATRRGRHYDLRIVTPDRAISFVIPWPDLMQDPGAQTTFIRMPDHVPAYATFEGQIPEGEYGAGGVRVANKYHGTINTDANGTTYLTVSDGTQHRRIMLPKPKDDKRYYAISRSMPSDRHWQERPQYKVFPENENENEYAASEKLDGALVYAKILPNGVTLTSRRKSTSGETIHKEHHVPWIRDIQLPKKYHGMVLAGELVHPKGFQFTSAILNSKPETALAKQKIMGRLYFAPHNILNQSMPYSDKIKTMREIAEKAQTPHIKLPRYSDNPKELMRRIMAEGGEGIVLFKPEEVNPQMYKRKLWNTYKGKVTKILPGTGKYSDSLGSMVVTDRDGNTVRVGGGKGLDDELRKDIYQNPDKYLGKVVRINALGSTGSSLRHPLFSGFELEGSPLDTFATTEALYQKYLDKFKGASYMSDALEQISADILSNPRYYPGTEKEPLHIKFNDRSHLGIGDHGLHLGTMLNGANVHVYQNKIFIIRPDGKAFTIPLQGEYSERAAQLLKRLEPFVQKFESKSVS